MMRKLSVKLLMLIFMLAMSVNAAWGAFDIGSIISGMEDLGPDDYYYTQLVATPSPSSSGTVQLMWIDMMGDTVNANDFTPEDPEKAQYTYMYALLNPGASGCSNPTGYIARPQLAATTVLYGEMEVPFGNQSTHVYITSFAYFKAEAQPADGWYFDGWSYVDNGQIQQVDTLRSGNNVLWPTDPRDPNEHNATIFKIKPHDVKGSKYLDPSQVSSESYDSTFRYVQANFKPVLLTGYRGGKSEIVVGSASVTFDVYVNIDAKKPVITVNDFNNPTLGDAKFTLAGMEGNVDAETGTPYAKVSVTFTAPDGMTAGTLYKTTMTASTKGGSTIEIPLEVRSVAADRTEATLYNADKTVAKDGDLLGEDGVLAAITGTDQLLQLNKNYASALTLTGKTVTLNLNGYTVSSLTIDGGEVTVDYSKYDNEASGALNVTSGKAVLNGGIFASLDISVGATVDQNGATITGAASNAGTLNTTEGTIKAGLVSTGALDVKGGVFRGEEAIVINGGTATFTRGNAIGTTCGLKVTNGTATVEKLMAIDGGTYAAQHTGGSLTINNGKFGNVLDGAPTLKTGYFKSNTIGVAIPEGKKLMNVAAGTEYEEGYRYFVGNAADALASNVGVCRIGSTSYAKLEDAIAYANNNPAEEGIIILMTNDCVLPAGYYTLPANATIVVPKDDSQENSNSIVRRTVLAYQKPSEFRRLTFASGVNMQVFGSIEVSCLQHANDVSNHGYNSNPWGPYGHLVLEENTKLTLQDGSHIYAWGFVTGKGEIDARRGSTIHEQFQMGDWKGGTTSASLLTDERGVFPVTQYYIQNVEAPAKFHPGAVLTASAAVSVLNGMIVAFANDINIVGVNGRDDAMFLLDNEADAENTWVRKWYDNATDYQMYQVNNTAHIGSIVLKLGKLGSMDLDMNSALFKLPITNNMNIHLLSGFMDFTQDTYLLPGAEVEVDKESVVSITDVQEEGVHSGSLYIYDADDWGDWVYNGSGSSNVYTKAVCYEPLVDGKPAIRPEYKEGGQKDATILVHGQFDTDQGYIFTSAGGANICSTNEDAGTFSFSTEAKAPGYTEEVYHAVGTSISGTPDVFYPAKLKNKAEDSFTETAGTGANMSYCYMDDEWRMRFYFNGYAADVDMEVYAVEAGKKAYGKDYDLGSAVTHIYIKPQEWVEIAGKATIEFDWSTPTPDYEHDPYNPYLVGVEGNSDHTYSDAAGAGRLFIYTLTKEGKRQWWEVEKKDNLYHCIHPNNDTYYYWQGITPNPNDPEVMIPAHWEEKRFTITWKNWDGTPLETIGPDETPVTEYSVTYGTMAEFLGTNPTREKTIDYTYDFTGWSPALGPVTSDVTYTATFTQKPRKYTIVFQNEGGVEIERQFLTHNEVPVCENTPTKAGHTLVWSPAIAAVIGDVTYTATWKENPPTEYEITFFDYDGETILKQGDVNVGDMPVPPAQVNGKPATSEFTYEFDHWSPAVEKVSATSIKSYTAVYREVAKTFPVNFYYGSKSAENQIGATQFLEIGQDPVIPNDERLQLTEDDANVYQLVWTPQIQTVIGHEDDYTYEYVASYTSTPKQYSLTLKCTPSGAATITGARADYLYGATPTVTVKANTGYNFVSWSDGEPIGDPDEDGVYSRTVTINGNIELTVVCECPDCDKSTIIWKNEAGDAELATDLVPVASATIYHGAIPTKENSLDGQYSYTFYGWTTAANEGGTKYKNGMTPKVAEAENPAEQTYIYYACFTPVVRQYNVTLSSNIPNVCMLVGAGTYNYSESAANATVIVSGYDAVNYTFDGWYNGEDRVSTAESYSFAVQSDVDLVAKFTPVTYTITWKSEDGNSTLETDVEQSYGATTAFNGVEPMKDAHSFIGWTTAANGEGSFYAKGATPAVAGNATYYAYFAENTRSLEIGATGSKTLTEATDYTTFTITSNGVNSGQLINANNLSLLGEAIFKLQPASAIPGRTWYAVAAPWQVDVRTGIYANGKHLTVGRDFDIIEFNAESYAVNEAGEGNKNIWRYVEENGGVMMPGKLYLIYLASAQSSLEFHKTGGGISTTTLSLTTTSGSGAKANWNAIANPALYHANIDAGVEDYEVYNNSNDGSYTVKTDLSTTDLIVGQPIFVQVITPQPSVSADVASGIAPAPYRRAASASVDPENRFVVEIALNGMMNDRIIVQTAEEKANEYVIGQDLAKMGVGTRAAQMWMERYDSKLCKNTMEMTNDRAEYPLNIYAPAAGEYTISAVQQRGNETLYLTRDGEAIWNLSDGDYTISLSRGTTADYGLRVSARTPQVATGCDEVIADGAEKTQKVLVNNQIFIIRGDKVYTIDGQLVK